MSRLATCEYCGAWMHLLNGKPRCASNGCPNAAYPDEWEAQHASDLADAQYEDYLVRVGAGECDELEPAPELPF